MPVARPARPVPRALAPATGTVAVLLALAAVVVLTPVLPSGRRQVLANVLQVVLAAGAAATTGWWSRRCRGRRRAAWTAVALGCVGWAAGQAVWTWYEQVLHRETPFPSWADVGFLAFPLGMTTALWLYPGRGGWRQRRRVLDALTVTAALGLVSWVVALGRVVSAGADGVLGFAVSVAYPASDLVVLVLTVLILAAVRTDRASLALLGSGLVAFCLADSAFAGLTASGSFSTGHVVDLGWMLGFALIALAPLAAREREAEQEAPATAARAAVAPYLAVLLAGVVTVWLQVTSGGLDQAEQALVRVIVVLVLARQFATLRQNGALVQELAVREAELRHQAFHDGLTGLANRALFLDRLEHALALHASDLRPLAVLLCDLDDFKVVNDTRGHAEGDALLVRVAERLRGALRTADTLARLGGDEFAVLLEHGDDAELVATRVVDALAAPFVVGGTHLEVGASVGLALVGRDEATPSAGELLVRADTAMYAAKRSGKRQVCRYSDGMSLVEVEEQRLADALRAALASGQVDVAYQPVVTVGTGEVEGLECLARWTLDGRPVPPSTFVPVAERAGLVAALTDHVLERACAQLVRWDAELGHRRLRVGVNVAPQDVVSGSLPSRVAAALARHDVDADRLVLEVTETGLLPDVAAARASTRALADLGVRLALDDFGVGYSSLSHLSSIPLRILKIDRAFTAGLGTDPDQERFVRALLALGHDLGLHVVAEGVERPQQLALLRQMGCDMAQGYLLARPMPAADVVAHLRGVVPAARTAALDHAR